MRTDAAGSGKVVIPMEGMHCASCVAAVEGALASLPGVRSASVHLPSNTAAVEYDPSRLAPEAIEAAVEALGFRVLGLAANYGQAEAMLSGVETRRSRALGLRLLGGGVLWLVLIFERRLGISPYTAWLAGTMVQVVCAWHFHQGLAASWRRKIADMNTLVSLSTWAAYLYGSGVVFFPELLGTPADRHQLEGLAGLVTLVGLGRWLETFLRRRSNDAVGRLMRKAPKTVRALRVSPGGKVEEVLLPLEEVEIGDRILVRPGEQVGSDGAVLEGGSVVDESLLTGESEPVEKAPGSKVYGGTLNKTGALVVRVQRLGSEMALARIIEAVRAGAASKAPAQKAADRVAGRFVPAVLAIAVIAAGLWLWKGPSPKGRHALTVFVSVLAVACPCALGLATPMALILGVGRAAESGIFLRNAEALEKAGRLDAVLFDKTGTLTLGRPAVTRVLPAPGIGPGTLLSAALAAEQRSEHPFAEAVRARAALEGLEPDPVDSFEALPGRGVRALSRRRGLLAGSVAWLREEGVPMEPGFARSLDAESGALLAVASDGALLGALVLEDELRPGAREAVDRLKALGLEVVLASGDREPNVRRVAREAGIDRVHAELRPEDKARIVAELQASGRRVAMVGEGFNDAPALSRADLGIALAEGTDVAVEAADITLMRPDLGHIVTAIELSRRIRRVIWENLAWAFAYNVALIPVAAGALYPWLGVTLRPEAAGAAMALSSISVVLNSIKLRRWRPS